MYLPKHFEETRPEVLHEMIRAHPVHMPAFEPLPDWTGWWMECPDRIQIPFVRKAWPEHRAAVTERLDEELFVLMMMGDDRAVRATYVRGEPVRPQP